MGKAIRAEGTWPGSFKGPLHSAAYLNIGPRRNIFDIFLLGLSCGTRDLFCIMQDLFLVAFTVSSCGTQASVVAVRGLSCSKARILVSRPGIETSSPAFQGRFLTTGTTMEAHTQV